MRSIRLVAMLAFALFAARDAHAAEPLTILSGDTSGVYYPVAIAVGKILSDGLPDRTIQVEVSKGSVANLNALAQGQGDLAFATADAIEAAHTGDRASGFDKPLTALRIVAALYPNTIQIVASARSGIRKLSDLKGKRLAVGAPQSGTELNARAILDAAGLDDGEIGAVKMLSFSQSITQMKEDKLDATLQSAGLGVASLNELSNTMDIVIIPIPPEVVGKLGAPFKAVTIPASTYRGQSEDVPTAEVMNFLVTRADVPDGDVTRWVSLMVDRLDEIRQAHPIARDVSLTTMLQPGPIPMHPAAERLLRSRVKRAEADALNARGEARLAKGERAAALADFAGALKIEPQHQAARDNHKALARTLERDGALMGAGGKK